MASSLTRALDALFHAAGDVRAAAGAMRPITPAEFQQQRALLALAARIRTDVARIGNAREEGICLAGMTRAMAKLASPRAEAA